MSQSFRAQGILNHTTGLCRGLVEKRQADVSPTWPSFRECAVNVFCLILDAGAFCTAVRPEGVCYDGLREGGGSEPRNILITMTQQVWLSTKLGGGRMMVPFLLCIQGPFSLIVDSPPLALQPLSSDPFACFSLVINRCFLIFQLYILCCINVQKKICSQTVYFKQL